MIEPQAIDFSTLPWVPLDATAGFPQQPAIYFAIDSTGKVQYIGQTINARRRWQKHHRYDDLALLGGVKIAYLFIDTPALLTEIEKALLLWFNPPLNKQGKRKVIDHQLGESELRFNAQTEPRVKGPVGRRINNADAERAKIAWSKGLGTTSDQRPLSFKFPPAIDAILRSMGSGKADYVRSAVEAKLREDRLL